MEYCPDGDLSDRIAAAHGRSISSGEDDEGMEEEDLPDLPDELGPEHDKVMIPEPQVLTWLAQMAEALEYHPAAPAGNKIHRL
jgi:hypothetical protein